MHKYGIRPPRRKSQRIWLTQSVDGHHFTNLIKDIVPNRLEQIWVSDLTYLKFKDKFVYLATVEDVFTREIVAAQMSDKHDSVLAFSAIHAAVSLAHKHPDYFHTDQGSEFMAEMVTDYDENGDLNRFNGLGELVEEIYSYIYYYNNLRIHTSLKMPPVRSKQKFLDAESLSRKWGT